jgi:hypothetical protein
VLLVLYMIDNLFNAMFNPIYLVSAGALVSLVSRRARVFIRHEGQPVAAGFLASGSLRLLKEPSYNEHRCSSD